MCNSLPPRASHLRPPDDAASVVECLRPRGEHDYNIFLTLTPLSGPQEGPWRSQARLNTTHTRPPPSPPPGARQRRPAATQAGKERKGRTTGEGESGGKRGEGQAGPDGPLLGFCSQEVEVVVEVTGGWAWGPWRSHSAISPSMQFQGDRWKGSYSLGVAQREGCPALGACLSTGGLRWGG